MNNNKNNSKKNLIITLLSLVIVLFVVTSTVAYITRSTVANNVITFGSLKMKLLQTTLNENNEEIEVDNNEDINITHKSELSRIVKIENLGKHDFYARISLNMVGTDSNNNEFDANEYVTYDVNTNDWIYKNGWYYYKKIVKQNELTSNLITNIEFNINEITTKFPNGNFKLDIKAEVVQAENNADNVLDALGWPSN